MLHRQPGGTVGERIRRLRDERGLSRKDLAVQTGLSARGIEDIENGASDPKTTTIAKLAKVFGVKLDELVEPGDVAARLRLIRLLADPGETPDDVTAAMMAYLKTLMEPPA